MKIVFTCISHGTVEEGVKKGFQPRVTLGTNLNQLNLE